MRRSYTQVSTLLLILAGCGDKESAPGDGDDAGAAPDSEDSDTPGTPTDSGGDSGGDTAVDTGHDTGDSGDSAVDTVDTGGESASRNWQWGVENTVEDADASLAGAQLGEWAGGSLLAPGDMDGDGYDDLVIGAPFNAEVDYDAGKIYFVFGRATGWSLHESLAGAPSVVGAGFDTELASTVAAGDPNSDGLADVILTSGFQNSAPSDDGYEYLVYGKASGWTPSVPVADVDVVIDNTNFTGANTDVKSQGPFGDMDGDGVDDWLVYGQVLFQGEAHVVSGTAVADGDEIPLTSALWVYGDAEQMYAEPLGDIDGDGTAELYVCDGDRREAGVILGGSGALPYDEPALAAADVSFSSGDSESIYLEDAGDMDGDGARDLALWRSEDGAYQSGIYLFFSRSAWPAALTLADADVTIGLGARTTGAYPVGDVNGDGLGDLAFPVSDGVTAVHTYLVFGRAAGWPVDIALADVDVHITPAADQIRMWPPRSSQQIGDLNGDGMDDLVLTTPYNNWGGVQYAGAMMIFAGRAKWSHDIDTAGADMWLVGSAQYETIGSWYLFSDLNADGSDDLVVSSFYRPVGAETGETFLFFGQPGP